MSYLGNNPNTAPSIVVSEHVATEGQTTFNASYYEYVQVFLNGMLLSASDYTANDGSTVVLAVGANAGDVILINGYEVGLQGPAGEVTAAQLSTAISGITKSTLGLGSVDNTSDVDKPISTATQTALNLKADATALTTKQDTLVSGTNIKTIGGASILGSGNIAVTAGYEQNFLLMGA